MTLPEPLALRPQGALTFNDERSVVAVTPPSVHFTSWKGGASRMIVFPVAESVTGCGGGPDRRWPFSVSTPNVTLLAIVTSGRVVAGLIRTEPCEDVEVQPELSENVEVQR